MNANVWEGVEVGLPQDKPATEKQHIAVVGAGPAAWRRPAWRPSAGTR